MDSDPLMAALVAAAEGLPEPDRAVLLQANATIRPGSASPGSPSGIDYLADVFGGISTPAAVRLAAALAEVARVALLNSGARADEASSAALDILARLTAAVGPLDGAQNARRN